MNSRQNKIELIKSYCHSQDFDKAEIEAKKLTKEYPKFSELYNLYGTILDRQNKLDEAILVYETAIKLKPDYFEPYYNMGSLFVKNRIAEKAIPLFKKTIELKPDFDGGYLALGSAFKYLRKFEESISIFRKIVELKPDFQGGHIALGAALHDNGQLKEAIPHLKKFGVASKARALECLYSIKDFEEFNKYLSEIAETNPLNLRAASIAAYASSQLDNENVYPFCKNPLDYIYVINIKSNLEPLDYNNFCEEISSFKEFWEKSGKVTVQAFKTHGNIFHNKTKCILKLQEVILDQIQKYRQKFSKSKDCIITHWPKLFNLFGWHVRYIKLGQQKSHIHPDGWISGSFYIKMPKNRAKNEGAIRFDLHGLDYPIFNKNKEVPSFEYIPKEGDLVLFPSSLFHSTIPCHSDEERKMIAFDVRPGSNKTI
tara:strand:- start:156 stop:1436 length:1281 start_codon:yes stop_codon:yes gene_type:complete